MSHKKEKPISKFRVKLAKVATIRTHNQLAKLLGVKVTRIRNWLYRGEPHDFTVKALKPTLDEEYAKLFTVPANGAPKGTKRHV